MHFDEEKLSYLPLFLNETIYVLRPQLEPSPAEIYKAPSMMETEKPAAMQVKVPIAQPASTEPIKPIPVAKPVSIAPPPAQIKNKNKVLILFNNENSPYLPKNEEALLKKILLSIKLDIDDVDLVNYNNIQRVDYVDLLKDKILNQLISFGVSLTALNLQLYLKKYQVERIEGVDMLLADSLSVIENSPDSKKLLWKALQQMFMK